MNPISRPVFLLFSLLLLLCSSLMLFPTTNGSRLFPEKITYRGREITDSETIPLRFSEAPEYRNGFHCPVLENDDGSMKLLACNPSAIHIAMTLDSEYLRGSIASVHSVLLHASCPENIIFHFVASESDSVVNTQFLNRVLHHTFPSLQFKLYLFKESVVANLISSSIRQALNNPLNYARSYLAELLDPCVERVIYLDSDTIVVDDIQKLWQVSLTGSRVIGAPEYCHANFQSYFSAEFWSDIEMVSEAFEGKSPCYFNTGVMVMDLVKWREGDYTTKIENWMKIQRERRIYELGSLPPFLLVFGGEVEGIEHRWNQHGLGGDNVVNNCRSLHPGPVSLLHWSGKGKPWVRLESKVPCPVDYLWKPYDLYKSYDEHGDQNPKQQIDS
ncbi:probable galacturonosyltransferase-like 10 [Humulus lupulus]|uniref:probable galacturonosyltransferase-like 10 n=1 Tax=Humulus lupulus TaxID=3486 RepID=UPI002B406244|nr:probable galacturonosyltransferase-like 10 [Humulus lupulus]